MKVQISRKFQILYVSIWCMIAWSFISAVGDGGGGGLHSCAHPRADVQQWLWQKKTIYRNRFEVALRCPTSLWQYFHIKVLSIGCTLLYIWYVVPVYTISCGFLSIPYSLPQSSKLLAAAVKRRKNQKRGQIYFLLRPSRSF